MTSFDEIINLYKLFPKYKNNTYEELYYHILPSINFNQYKIFKEDNIVFAFVNWAYLSESVEQTYKLDAKLFKTEWKSGNTLWLHDIIIYKNSKQVMNWVINHFKQQLNIDESINWLRIDEKDKLYRISKKFKRRFHS